MKKIFYECDRCKCQYEYPIVFRGIKLIRTTPHFGEKEIDLCDGCYTDYIIKNRMHLAFALIEPKEI